MTEKQFLEEADGIFEVAHKRRLLSSLVIIRDGKLVLTENYRPQKDELVLWKFTHQQIALGLSSKEWDNFHAALIKWFRQRKT